jgi:hypothetical protein
MRDFLAALIIIFAIWFLCVALSDKAPTDEFGKTVCANMTCYYEIKGNQ